MAQNQQTIECPVGIWTQLTNADVTALTFQVLRGAVFIRCTTDTTVPTEQEGIIYQPTQGMLTDDITALTYLTAADRVWAKPVGGTASAVYVDHA